MREDRWQNGEAIKQPKSTVNPDFSTIQERLPKQRVVRKILATSAAMRECIVDSGASVHIVSRKALSIKEKRRIRKAQYPMRLSTANGEVIVDAGDDLGEDAPVDDALELASKSSQRSLRRALAAGTDQGPKSRASIELSTPEWRAALARDGPGATAAPVARGRRRRRQRRRRR